MASVFANNSIAVLSAGTSRPAKPARYIGSCGVMTAFAAAAFQSGVCATSAKGQSKRRLRRAFMRNLYGLNVRFLTRHDAVTWDVLLQSTVLQAETQRQQTQFRFQYSSSCRQCEGAPCTSPGTQELTTFSLTNRLPTPAGTRALICCVVVPSVKRLLVTPTVLHVTKSSLHSTM
jgi:hypothetical protein